MITVATVNGARSVFRFPVKYAYNEPTCINALNTTSDL